MCSLEKYHLKTLLLFIPSDFFKVNINQVSQVSSFSTISVGYAFVANVFD